MIPSVWYSGGMLLFLLILIPSFLALFCIRSKDRAAVLLSCAGVAAGALVCLFLAFFFPMHRIPEDSFSSNFLHYFCGEYALPAAALFSAYFLLSKGGGLFRIRAFFPLCGGLLSIYMPYFILFSARQPASFFELFAKPALTLSMLLISANALYGMARAKREGASAKIAVCAAILAAACTVPPALNALWLLGLVHAAVLLSVCAAYTAFGALLFLSAMRRDESFFM